MHWGILRKGKKIESGELKVPGGVKRGWFSFLVTLFFICTPSDLLRCLEFSSWVGVISNCPFTNHKNQPKKSWVPPFSYTFSYTFSMYSFPTRMLFFFFSFHHLVRFYCKMKWNDTITNVIISQIGEMNQESADIPGRPQAVSNCFIPAAVLYQWYFPYS